MATITENLRFIHKKIERAALRAGRDPETIQLITVTKKVVPEKINEAIAAGATVIGENRVQEARDKFPGIDDCERYLIGNLQKNKVKYVLDLFSMIQSVDSVELAAEINKRANALDKVMDTLVQVNISGETSKSGVSPGSAQELITTISTMGNIRVRGLMCIPPFSSDPEESRPFFQQLVKLGKTINKTLDSSSQLCDFSMGMTNDFEIAIEEGATMVRVGTGIFGERN